MFRPFLPCGIAYGFAYGIPCSFSSGRHPAGLFVLYHIGAVLVNRFRQNFGGICLFPAPGGAPVSGGLLRRCRLGGRWRRPAGGVPSLLPAYPDFSLLYRPYPPSPRSQSALPRRGRGRLKVYFAGGFAPGTPAFNRLQHLQNLPSRYPKWGFASCEAGLRRRSDTLRRCAFGVASSAQNR